MKLYLEETKLLDFNNILIQQLITDNNWRNLDTRDQILNVYNYVRDEIKLGYNKKDEMKSSEVLKDHYGQCNTKGILLMSLLRALNIPCRLHGSYVDKKLQYGALKGLFYKLSPNEILHSWVEIFYNDEWLALEGVIVDKLYLNSVQNKVLCKGSYCGYAIGQRI